MDLVTYVLKYYELDQNFDDTEKILDNKSNVKDKLFRKIIVVIEEECSGGMNLTDGGTFLWL